MPKSGAQAVNLMFRAFSDRTRMRMLHLLDGGELCVGDIVRALRIPQPTASRHLAYLKRAGLVRCRRERAWCYYGLAPARNEFHEHMLDCLRSCCAQVPEMAADTLRARKLNVRAAGA